MPDYQLLHCNKHISFFEILHGTSCMNQLQAYSLFWPTLLPCMSHSFWSTGLGYEVPGPHTPWLLFDGAYEGHTPLATIAYKSRTHAANHGLCWLHTAKWWNYQKAINYVLDGQDSAYRTVEYILTSDQCDITENWRLLRLSNQNKWFSSVL